MAFSNDPIFTQGQRTASAVTTAAKTTYNDVTNAVLLATAGAQGSIVTRLTAIPRATAAANQLQLYVSNDGGTTISLLQTQVLSAYTMASSTQNTYVDFMFSDVAPLRLGPNDRLYVGQGVALAGGVSWIASVQDF